MSVANGQSDATDVGWVYYNAHFVNVETKSMVDTGWATAFHDQQFNVLVQHLSGSSIPSGQLVTPSDFFASTLIPAGSYLVIPVVVLLFAGFFLARISGARTPLESALTAGTIAVGTSIAAATGTVLFTYESELLVQPALLESVLMAGLFYPLVICPVGGVLASVVSFEGSSTRVAVLSRMKLFTSMDEGSTETAVQTATAPTSSTHADE